MSVEEIHTSNRLAFLILALARKGTPQAAVEDLIQGHRNSTRRQYESGWKKFQSFVGTQRFKEVTSAVLTDFASSLFHGSDIVAPATVTNAMVAIRDPMSYGFGVEVDKRSWELLRASFFNQRPPAKPTPPSWSLEKGLNLLQIPKFTSDPSPEDILMKTLFLTAMATEHRVSQLAALLGLARS